MIEYVIPSLIAYIVVSAIMSSRIAQIYRRTIAQDTQSRLDRTKLAPTPSSNPAKDCIPTFIVWLCVIGSISAPLATICLSGFTSGPRLTQTQCYFLHVQIMFQNGLLIFTMANLLSYMAINLSVLTCLICIGSIGAQIGIIAVAAFVSMLIENSLFPHGNMPAWLFPTVNIMLTSACAWVTWRFGLFDWSGRGVRL